MIVCRCGSKSDEATMTRKGMDLCRCCPSGRWPVSVITWIAGFQLVTQEVPVPVRFEMPTVVVVARLRIQRQSDPVTSVDRNLLLQTHERQIVFRHRLQARRYRLAEAAACGFLLIDKPPREESNRAVGEFRILG